MKHNHKKHKMSNQIQPSKQPAPAKPAQVESKADKKAKVEAYLRLVQLGAAPSVTFDAEHDALYQEVYAEAVKDVEQERYDEIIKNRKILDLGTGWDQMNVPEPVEVKEKREKSEHKPEGKVQTTKSF
jgi:hypothetical protein